MDGVRVIEGFAVLAQLPPMAALLLRPPGRDVVFWGAVAVAAVAAVAVAALLAAGGWQGGFVATLWTTLAGTLAIYLVVAALNREAWRLAPLVGAYSTVVAILSFLIHLAAGGHEPTASAPPTAWFFVHIATAVVTYGLVTLAAIAALAGWLQNSAVKTKKPTRLSRMLPSIAECEGLSLRLLGLGVAILSVGLATGVAIEYLNSGDWLPLNHKTVLTMAAFVVLAILLVVHYRTGMRGRGAVRVVLLGYLLLALGYPGVKFVTDVLLGR